MLIPVGTIEPWPQTAEGIELWFHRSGSALAQNLKDEAKFRKWGRGSPMGRFVFKHIRVTKLKPPSLEMVASQEESSGQAAVNRRQIVYKVLVPHVEEYQRWVFRDGQVIIGYRRPLPDIVEETVQRELRDGRSVVKSRSRKVVGRTQQISLEAEPQPGDSPAVANSLSFYVTDDGVIYF